MGSVRNGQAHGKVALSPLLCRVEVKSSRIHSCTLKHPRLLSVGASDRLKQPRLNVQVSPGAYERRWVREGVRCAALGCVALVY